MKFPQRSKVRPDALHLRIDTPEERSMQDAEMSIKTGPDRSWIKAS